ncbi:MAG TPA: hypothetical protein VEA81_17495 [Burkholderiaceae bacterium]|nr:hypothetical protein [Burkholderiaceae bacterium]
MSQPSPRRGASSVAWLAALAFGPTVALAQVPSTAATLMNLEPQLPTEVEDAEVTPQGVRELQLPIRMVRERDSDNRFLVEPRFQIGLLPRLQATIGVPLVVGSSDRTNSGNLRGDLLYKFTNEGGVLPALAGGFGIELPTGKDAEGTDTTLRLVATKTLGARPGTHQIHGNAIWRRNDDPRAGERDDTSRFILGYSTPLSDSTVIVADLVRGHGRLGATSMQTVYEVGIRQAFTRGTTLALGLARGRGPDSPNWQVTAGFQSQF